MPNSHSPHIDLQETAKEVMVQRGFQPDFSPQVRDQLAELKKHRWDRKPTRWSD